MPTNLYLENVCIDPWNDFVTADFFFLKSGVEILKLD